MQRREQQRQATALDIPNIDKIIDLFAFATGGRMKKFMQITGKVSSEKKLKRPRITMKIESETDRPTTIRFTFIRADPEKNIPRDYIKVDGFRPQGYYNNYSFFGTLEEDSKFYPSKYCTSEVVDFIKEFANDPTGIAGEQGKKSGCCCFCHKPLTIEDSFYWGWGPICAKNWGLPWGVPSPKADNSNE
jgi:hypothetical protein